MDRLYEVLDIASEEGVAIDYVETNSSWFKGFESACLVLENLMSRGVLTLLISISPLHNEFIPFTRTRGVIEACRETGMGIFPWVSDFLQDLEQMNVRATHSIKEYEEVFGEGYLSSLPRRYWIAAGGRALETFAPFRPQQSVEQMEQGSSPCTELAETGHFHLDLFGNYIPGLCAGLSIRRDDLGKPLEKETYPLLHTLYSQGIGGLLQYVRTQYNYQPGRETYGSKCELCYEIRHFLAERKNINSHELQPPQHYQDK